MPKCSALPQLLALLGGVAFAACQWLVFAYAPEEATLGLVQKIFYIHLPMSWWALVSFLVVFGASVAYLWRRNPAADRLAAAAAESAEAGHLAEAGHTLRQAMAAAIKTLDAELAG